MRRSGIVHAELAAALTGLRHTDLFAISDSGLPVPTGVQLVDLGVSYGMPKFLPVLDLVLAEVEVEAAWTSADIEVRNPDLAAALSERVEPEALEHEEFKARIGRCRFVVRTGEATPYANVLLQSGVPWMD